MVCISAIFYETYLFSSLKKTWRFVEKFACCICKWEKVKGNKFERIWRFSLEPNSFLKTICYVCLVAYLLMIFLAFGLLRFFHWILLLSNTIIRYLVIELPIDINRFSYNVFRISEIETLALCLKVHFQTLWITLWHFNIYSSSM